MDAAPTIHAKNIRSGRMLRDEAIALIEKYDPVKPRDLARWLAYVGMSEDEFGRIADTFRDDRVWAMEGTGSEKSLSFFSKGPPVTIFQRFLPTTRQFGSGPASQEERYEFEAAERLEFRIVYFLHTVGFDLTF